MSKRKKELQKPVIVTLANNGDELFQTAKNLALKMINIEQDPDIVSVFSIARAHGYKTTSKLWSEELEALKKVLIGIEERAKQAIEAEQKPSPVVPVK